MTVLMLSSYPAHRCGVSDYTRQLADHMPRGVTVTHRQLDLRQAAAPYLRQTLRAMAGVLLRRPAILHVQYTPTTTGPAALLLVALARLCGTPVCITAHERPSTYMRRLPLPARRLFRAFERALFALSDRTLVLSHTHAQELLTAYGAQALVVHLGVREGPRESQRDDRRPTITVAGFLRPSKGIEDVIDAAPVLARCVGPIRVQIVGAVEPRDRQYAEDLKSRASTATSDACEIRFVEGPSDAEFERLVVASDIYVFPSRTASQSITLNIVLEARLPVVGAAGSGVAEIVQEHGLGAVYPPANVDALARAVGQLLQDHEAYAACQANIERFVRLAGWGAVSGAHAAGYRELRAA